MARKKAAAQLEGSSIILDNKSAPQATTSTAAAKAPKSRDKEATSAPASLTISRNKHWRYISAFHGPWLSLPHEILETLAHSNYFSPRPRQTDPSVLYDLLRVRKLVDEAADLAVRAQNGTASSALNADNGFPGSALGLNTRGAGGNAKLSPERKHRMRELATQKLAQAYSLDEVAASVATMQSASALDTVASLVLQRAPANLDAKYVHFFHEKIPSRMMAEYTSLTPLNDIIAQESGHAAPYRTRALTKIFKEDFAGAAQDLTEALAICRMEQARHAADKNQLVSLKAAREDAEKRKVADDDQPKGLEMQLLFQRGNQYLSLACQHISQALKAFREAQRQRDADTSKASGLADGEVEPPVTSSTEMEAYRRGLEARELARKYAKRALRDYTAFFRNLDYAYATTQDIKSTVFDQDTLLDATNQIHDNRTSVEHKLITRSQSLVRRPTHQSNETSPERTTLPSEPLLKVHSTDTVLSSAPPQDLPPYPPVDSDALTLCNHAHLKDAADKPLHEIVTYHPLMPETVHSLLLAHCILQTPQTTFSRIANNAARLARLADGYPFFLSARSPARADWAEILRKTRNWIGLSATWDRLCKADSTGSASDNTITDSQNGLMRKGERKQQSAKPAPRETEEQHKDRIHKDAVMEALGDERVVDDASFQRAVAAREKRAYSDMNSNGLYNGTSNGTNGLGGSKVDDDVPKSAAEPFGRRNGSAVAKDEEYLIGTERAETIAKWIMEAPAVVEGAATGRPKKKKKPVNRRVNDIEEVQNRVNGLSLDGADEAAT